MSAYEYERQRADRAERELIVYKDQRGHLASQLEESHDELAEAEQERDEFKRLYDELNGALCWGTTCLNCASLLDKSYADYIRAEKAQAALRALREKTGTCEGDSEANCFCEVAE